MNHRTFSSQAFVSCSLFFLCSYDYPKLTEQDIEKDSEPYDVIIVPGVPYEDPTLKIIFKARILWAKYLYDHEIAKNIIFSGSSVYNPYIEGEIMRIYADSLGIPSSHTFSETQAEHSTENIYYSLLMAKRLGFKKIAIATDQYQAIIIRRFIRQNCPEVKVIKIEYDKINLITAPWPAIDPSSAYVNNFVSLVDRENKVKRFMGTLGKNIGPAESDSCDGQKKKPVYSLTGFGKNPNSWVSSASSIFPFFNTTEQIEP